MTLPGGDRPQQACPLCGRPMAMQASLTARLWRWQGRCHGGTEDTEGSLGALLERHHPAVIEVTAKPEEKRWPKKRLR